MSKWKRIRMDKGHISLGDIAVWREDYSGAGIARELEIRKRPYKGEYLVLAVGIDAIAKSKKEAFEIAKHYMRTH